MQIFSIPHISQRGMFGWFYGRDGTVERAYIRYDYDYLYEY